MHQGKTGVMVMSLCPQADTDEESEGGPGSSGCPQTGSRSGAGAWRSCAPTGSSMGTAHVGFRENDAPELTRWAAKQRSDWRAGDLRQDRQG